METKVKWESPGGDRGDFVRAAVVEPVDRILDIGCGYGWTINGLTGMARELVGIDMDQVALDSAKSNYPHITFVHQNASTLPFESNEFDVAILSEVIEHVGDENKQLVIDEAHRVLKDGGLFIFTAPYAGMFAWADPMDFKRRFPGIYKTYMRLSNYTPKDSIEVGHKHVSMPEIQKLFEDRFDIEHVRYCGLFMPLFTWILAADVRLRWLPARTHEALNVFRGKESGKRYPKIFAFNVRLTARKKHRVEANHPVETKKEPVEPGATASVS